MRGTVHDPPHRRLHPEASTGFSRREEISRGCPGADTDTHGAKLRAVEAGQRQEREFGFSMEFADQAAYDTYNGHPIHVAFVRDRWKAEVSDFMEIDYLKI